MRVFQCQCGNTLFFRNTRCTGCNQQIGYAPWLGAMLTGSANGQAWVAANGHRHPVRPCRNYTEEDVCNWLVTADDVSDWCWACRLNEMIPDLSRPNHHHYWYRVEAAKRHLLYTLYQLRLPVRGKDFDPDMGLSFVFIGDPDEAGEFDDELGGSGRVMTGHLNGRITINIAEADDVERTRVREMFSEPYRTVLGHFRHEIGHYYWDLLVSNTPVLAEFRRLFGDETQDYEAARQRHYENGPSPGWQDHYISAYASMHPWEDWAESWAHYLHMTDTLETAAEFGFLDQVVARDASFETRLQAWQTLTPGLNALCRSMGVQDIYPFVIHQQAQAKLALVHDVISTAAAA